RTSTCARKCGADVGTWLLPERSEPVLTAHNEARPPHQAFFKGSSASGSEADSQPKPELALVDAFAREVGGAGDFGIAAEIANRLVRKERRVRHVRARVAEVRRVAEVEGFGSELKLPSLRQRELPEQTEVPVGDARAAQRVQAGRTEARLRHLVESERIEVGLAAADAAQLLHGGLHLIGGLGGTRKRRRGWGGPIRAG